MGGSPGLLWLIFWVGPLAAGLVLAFAKPAEAVVWVNDASAWWSRRYLAAKAKGGLFVGSFWRWLIWGFHKLDGWTASIADEAVRAGVRAALFFYIGGLSLFVMASAVYLVVVLAMIALGFWVLGKMLKSADDGTFNAPRSAGRRAHAPGPSDGRSREKKDMWGNAYTEHRNHDGDVVATSAARKDMWGNDYVETRDRDGDITQTSAARKDWLGNDYTETRGSDGDVTQTSAARQDWVGDDYVEHRDRNGDVTGTSKDGQDWLGDDVVDHRPKK